MEESLLKVLAAWGYHVQLGAAIWVTVLFRVLKTQCGRPVFHGHSLTSFRGGHLSYWRMAEGNTLWTFIIPSSGQGASFICFSSIFTKTHFTNEKIKVWKLKKSAGDQVSNATVPKLHACFLLSMSASEKIPHKAKLKSTPEKLQWKELASVQRTDDKARTYWARSMARLSSKYPTLLTSSPNYSMWPPLTLPSSYRWENWSVGGIWLHSLIRARCEILRDCMTQLLNTNIIKN